MFAFASKGKGMRRGVTKNYGAVSRLDTPTTTFFLQHRVLRKKKRMQGRGKNEEIRARENFSTIFPHAVLQALSFYNIIRHFSQLFLQSFSSHAIIKIIRCRS